MPILLRRRCQVFSLRAALAFSLCFVPFMLESPSFAAAKGGSFYQMPPDAFVAGKPFTAAQLETLVPATVYFRSKVAPVQLRNAGGVRFANEGIFLAAMVDASGYSSSIQETYQFYLVTEKPVRFGGQVLQPGAYGAGFVNDKFIVMDLGGKNVLQGDTQEDKEMKRPRPLQVLPVTENSIKLYLGRHYVLVDAVP